MSKIARKKIADQALTHLNEVAPKNTCVSKGMDQWTRELGLPSIGTASVSEAKARALQGYNGWSYIENVDEAEIGDFLDWEPVVLGDPTDRHVSVLVERDDMGQLKTIGAGGPTGRVFFQPQSGGYNPPSYFRGFFRAPLNVAGVSPRTTGSIKTQPATYTVKRGDILLRIASKHQTTVGQLVKLNGLRNPDHIEVGQKLKLR